jgi:hypothetical protein
VKIHSVLFLAAGLCAVVAPVLSEEIVGDPNGPVAGQVLGTVIRTADAFWHYYVTDSLHSFYPPGSAEEASAFESPGWLSD